MSVILEDAEKYYVMQPGEKVPGQPRTRTRRYLSENPTIIQWLADSGVLDRRLFLGSPDEFQKWLDAGHKLALWRFTSRTGIFRSVLLCDAENSQVVGDCLQYKDGEPRPLYYTGVFNEDPYNVDAFVTDETDVIAEKKAKRMIEKQIRTLARGRYK